MRKDTSLYLSKFSSKGRILFLVASRIRPRSEAEKHDD